jgi:hypothetical protein
MPQCPSVPVPKCPSAQVPKCQSAQVPELVHQSGAKLIRNPVFYGNPMHCKQTHEQTVDELAFLSPCEPNPSPLPYLATGVPLNVLLFLVLSRFL